LRNFKLNFIVLKAYLYSYLTVAQLQWYGTIEIFSDNFDNIYNAMVTLDFRPEVEIRSFRACAMKNTKYNPYLWLNRQHFCVLKEIGVEEHDGDVRFKSGSGNMAVSCMRTASGNNYRKSSVVVDLAMGQIPRSTKRISSCKKHLHTAVELNVKQVQTVPDIVKLRKYRMLKQFHLVKIMIL